MKKRLCLLMATLAMLILPACGNSEAEINAALESVPYSELDLTKLSNTMMYSELQNIVSNPDDYAGRTIRLRGKCQSYYYEKTNEVYHAVTVTDVTSCCAQGLEYILDDARDYPSDGSEITVTGELVSYEEQGYIYYHLENVSII